METRLELDIVRSSGSGIYVPPSQHGKNNASLTLSDAYQGNLLLSLTLSGAYQGNILL
ncbi:hypothetical protein TWF173_010261 [Orbilia oligospora]|nr:hypothetical protein TWF173_010261 [Orbilia oligospora]